MSQAWADHLDLLIRARTPILWIRSQEEERIAALLSAAAKRPPPVKAAVKPSAAKPKAAPAPLESTPT